MAKVRLLQNARVLLQLIIIIPLILIKMVDMFITGFWFCQSTCKQRRVSFLNVVSLRQEVSSVPIDIHGEWLGCVFSLKGVSSLKVAKPCPF